MLLDSLTGEQSRSHPDAVADLIAWLFWHIARGGDVYMHRLLSDRPQVLDAEGWPARLNAPLHNP